MEPMWFSDHLLFAVFRFYNSEHRYLNDECARYQPSFDASREGVAIERFLPLVRYLYFQRIRNEPMMLTEHSFNYLSRLACDMYPERDELLPRLVCIACLGHRFVSYGTNAAREWAFQNIFNQISRHIPLLTIETMRGG